MFEISRNGRVLAFSEDFETDFELKQNGGAMEYSRDLTNLDLGAGLGRRPVGRIGKFSFRMRDKNIYDTF